MSNPPMSSSRYVSFDRDSIIRSSMSFTISHFYYVCGWVFLTASFCGDCLLIGSDGMARISLVYGSVSERRNQYVVFDNATGIIQTKRSNPPGNHGNGLHCLLRFLDHYSRFYFPRHHGNLLSNGLRNRANHRKIVALAHDVHSHSFLFMCIESQMDVRSISTHFRPHVLRFRSNTSNTDCQWTVKNPTTSANNFRTCGRKYRHETVVIFFWM